MPNKRFTSPGRTYRRSQVALLFGLLALAIATGFAIQFDVKGGDLFSGLMAGAGAIGALMAAYEAADAAEGSAEAAQQANDLTLRQSLPSLFLTLRPSTFIDSRRFTLKFKWAHVHSLIIDNVGGAYTAATKIKFYGYYEDKKQKSGSIEKRFLLPQWSSPL